MSKSKATIEREKAEYAQQQVKLALASVGSTGVMAMSVIKAKNIARKAAAIDKAKTKAAEFLGYCPGAFLKLVAFTDSTLSCQDADGDYLRAEGCVEYNDMYGTPIKVLVYETVDPVVAARQLQKMADWLIQSPHLMNLRRGPINVVIRPQS